MRARKRLHQEKTADIGILQSVAIAMAGTGITGINDATLRPNPSDGKGDAEGEAAAYAKFREEMAAEEKHEFKAKLWVSWSLFTAFWLVGSAIFMATEGWSYGTAVYFCGSP
jgi:hypothetical protein